MDLDILDNELFWAYGMLLFYVIFPILAFLLYFIMNFIIVFIYDYSDFKEWKKEQEKKTIV